jgi:hypothetical protein
MNRFRFRRGNPIWVACLALALVAGALPAQSANGVLQGRLTDEQSAAVPGASITATNVDTGVSRVTTSGADGVFRFGALPAGTYDVKVELAGFATVTQQGVSINVASTRELDVAMKLASVEAAITVTDQAPLIATEASIGTVVSQNELQNLPLNGRQFANVAILAPGTALDYNTDPTKPGQLVVQLNGGTGRNVNYIIDGGDNTDDTIGGALQNFNLEAVQEFKIQTMQYKAEYGRSSGGVLSVVTKTGTNDFRGSAWGYFRDDSWNAKTETERLAGNDKAAYERKQYGATLGGPIVRDRAHFFVTYEKTERDTNYTIFTGGAFPQFDGQVVATPFEDELITAKGTVDLSPTQYLQVRYGYQTNDDKYGASLRPAPSGLGTITNEYESILVGHTAQLGSNKLNEIVVQYTSFDNTISADSDDPLIYYPSGFFTGQNLNTPQSTQQRKRQFKDDFSWSQNLWGRRNDFKAGINYIDEPTLGGDFTTGTAGQYQALEDRVGSPISLIQVYGGFFGDSTPIEYKNAYLQDDLYFSDRLTVNVGVRYDLWTGYDLDQRSNALWQNLSTQRTFSEWYLRDFWGDDGVLDEDEDNISARIGFVYDLKGDGRMLLRGGYGTYYDFPYTNATILFPASEVQSAYGLVYENADPNGIRNPDGSFYQAGQPLPPNQITDPELGGLGEVASPNLATPYSDQASLGLSWQPNDWLGLNFEVISIDYHDIPFRFRPNVLDPATGARRFGGGNFRLWLGNGRGSYEGANVGFRIRKEKWEAQGFYTYSEAESNVIGGVDEFRLTGGDFQPGTGGSRNRRDQSVNPLDPLCGACFGPVYSDSKHKITVGGTYRAPWDLVVGGMLRYRSATPYTRYAGFDVNGDLAELDLAPGVSSVNSERGSDFTQIDLRVSRDFQFGREGFGIELIAEVFNLLDDENPALHGADGQPTAYAGDPGQGEQRLWQFGARIHF